MRLARLLKGSPESADTRGPLNYPVLHAAVRVQNIAIVKQLIEAGANLEIGYNYSSWYKTDNRGTALDHDNERAEDTKEDPKMHVRSMQIVELLEQTEKRK
jgi:ankyrin repeat protein